MSQSFSPRKLSCLDAEQGWKYTGAAEPAEFAVLLEAEVQDNQATAAGANSLS